MNMVTLTSLGTIMLPNEPCKSRLKSELSTRQQLPEFQTREDLDEQSKNSSPGSHHTFLHHQIDQSPLLCHQVQCYCKTCQLQFEIPRKNEHSVLDMKDQYDLSIPRFLYMQDSYRILCKTRI